MYGCPGWARIAPPDFHRRVLPHGKFARVMAPSSGEGIHYAIMGGRVAAMAASACLASMQNAYYRSDERRERFVSLCHDIDEQRLTFEANMNKKLVRARPLAHVKTGLGNLAQLTGLASPART